MAILLCDLPHVPCGEKIVEDKTLSEDEVVKRFDSTTTKMKFKAFGKTKPVSRKSADQRLEERLKAAQGLDDEPRVKELMRKQHNTIEMEINKLKEGKFGKVTNIFKMKEIVSGSKKGPQDPHAVKDVNTDELVVASTEIKRVTLNHCMNTFKHSLPHENVEALVNIVNSVHETRMVEGEEEPFVVTEDDFEELLKRLEKKNKRSYDF